MATAAVTNSFVNGTIADADEVNTNFQDLVDFLNNSVIHKDGSVAFTGEVQGIDPSVDAALATKKYVDDKVIVAASQSGFKARLTSDQVVGEAAASTIKFGTENFDSDAQYNTSTGIFTVASGLDGAWLFSAQLWIEASVAGIEGTVRNRYLEDGGVLRVGRMGHLTAYNDDNRVAVTVTWLADMEAGDTAQIVLEGDEPSATGETFTAKANNCWFQGYRLGGI